jgi:hypothetical protein
MYRVCVTHLADTSSSLPPNQPAKMSQIWRACLGCPPPLPPSPFPPTRVSELR